MKIAIGVAANFRIRRKPGLKDASGGMDGHLEWDSTGFPMAGPWPIASSGPPGTPPIKRRFAVFYR